MTRVLVGLMLLLLGLMAYSIFNPSTYYIIAIENELDYRKGGEVHILTYAKNEVVQYPVYFNAKQDLETYIAYLRTKGVVENEW
jgi:hypothetical protein